MGTRGPQNAATAVAAAASATAAALEPWPKGRTAAVQPSTPESLGATATALMSLSWAATAAVTRSLAGSSASGDTSERSQTCYRVGGGRGCTVCVRLAWGDETQRARRSGPLPAGQHDRPCPAHSCQTRTACMPVPAKQLHATLIASGPLAPSKQLHARPGGQRATTCKPHLGAPSGSLLDVPKPTLSSLAQWAAGQPKAVHWSADYCQTTYKPQQETCPPSAACRRHRMPGTCRPAAQTPRN